MSKPESRSVPPLRLTVIDLQNLMNMCEGHIKMAEVSGHLFGNVDVVEQREISSNLQSRFKQELYRQSLIAEEKQAEADKKKEPEPTPAKG